MGTSCLATILKRTHVSNFFYHELVLWTNSVRDKQPSRFEPTASFHAVAIFDRGAKRDELPQDIHGIKDICALNRCLVAWHSKKKKGLKVEVTAILSELSTAINIALTLLPNTQDISTQLASSQLGGLLAGLLD